MNLTFKNPHLNIQKNLNTHLFKKANSTEIN